MLWLLPYFAYAAAASAGFAAVSYTAVTQLSVIKRIIVAVLERALKKFAVTGKDGYTINRTPTGIVVTNITFTGDALRHATFAHTQPTAVSIQQLELDLPGNSRPLALRVQGVRVTMQQIQIPEPISKEKLNQMQQEQAEKAKKQCLDLIDELLWGHDADGAPKPAGWSPGAGAFTDRLQAKAVQKVVAFVVQYLHVEVLDVIAKYTQIGEPGPKPATNHLQGADAAVLAVRTLTLVPQGEAFINQQHQGSQPFSVYDDGDIREPATARGGGVGRAASALGALSGSGTGVFADGQPSADDLTWWKVLSFIPQLFWSRVMIHKPSSSRLTLAGVSLKLQTYPSLWAGHAAALSARAPRPGVFSFVGGSLYRAAIRSPSPIGKSPQKRRRTAGTAGRSLTASSLMEIDEDGDGTEDENTTTASARSSNPSPSKDKASSNSTRKGVLDFSKMLDLMTPEEHVIIRQWELSVLIGLVPKGVEQGDGVPASSRATTPSPARAPPTTTTTTTAATLAAEDSTPKLPGKSNVTTMMHPQRCLERSSFHQTSFGAYTATYTTPSGVATAGYRSVQEDAAMQDEDSPSSSLESDFYSVSEASASSPLTDDGADSSSTTAAAVAAAGVYAATNNKNATGHQEAPARNSSKAASTSSPSTAQPGTPSRLDDLQDIRNGNAAATNGTSSSMTSVTLDIVVSLKAFVPEVNPASLGILVRLIERQSHLSHFGQHWQLRPQVPVHGHASVWWKHAGRAIQEKTADLARRNVPLSSIARRGRRRQEYQELYAVAHANDPRFQEPGRTSWWSSRKVKVADEDDLERLKAIEARMTVEEIAHFRFGVAATHNKSLANSPSFTQFAADKVDALVYTRDQAIRLGLRQMLLHYDEVATLLPGSNGPLFSLQIAVTCPKLGLIFDLKPHSTQSAPDAPVLELSLKSITLGMDAGGKLSAQVECLQCATCEAPSSPMTGPKILASPSGVCRRVCKAAEFFRYAVSGALLSDSAAIGSNAAPGVFCHATILPRPGIGGLTHAKVDALTSTVPPLPTSTGGNTATTTSGDIDEWVPGGYDIKVSLGVIGLVYDGSTFSALLGFAESWEKYRLAPWEWGMSYLDSQQIASNGVGNNNNKNREQWPPPLPAKPESVTNMVLHSFEARGAVVKGEMNTAVTVVELYCPGVALQLPYRHRPYAELLGEKKLPNPSVRTSFSSAVPKSAMANKDGSSAAAADGTGMAKHAKPTPRKVSIQTGYGTGEGSPSKQPGARMEEQPAVSPRPGSGSGDTSSSSTAHYFTKPVAPDHPQLHYLFTVAIQNIRLRVAPESAASSLRGGAARRMDAETFLDVFSYLSTDGRRAIAASILHSRGMLDPLTRPNTASEEMEAITRIEAELREAEIGCMAKVWAYPEDMPTVMDGIRKQEHKMKEQQLFAASLDDAARYMWSSSRNRRGSSSSGGGGGGGGVQTGGNANNNNAHSAYTAHPLFPPNLFRNPTSYPMPLVPFLKCGSMRLQVAETLTVLPDEPGGSVIAAAASAGGIQAWISPIHVWHLVAVGKAVQQVVDYMSRSSILDSSSDGEESVIDDEDATAAAGVAMQLSSRAANHNQRKLVISINITEASVLWMVGTWTKKEQSAGSLYRRNWGITVQRDDPAFIWAKWLAAVYSLSVGNVRGTLQLHGQGKKVASLTVDGVLMRDLQLPDGAKHAYVLRPLPARASRMNSSIRHARRIMLGMQTEKPAKRLWKRAMLAVDLRKATSALQRSKLTQSSSGQQQDGSNKKMAVYVLFGPQIRLNYTSSTRGGDDLSAEIGQMLVYARVKQHASMTVFATQLAQITSYFVGNTNMSSGAAADGTSTEKPSSSSNVAAAARLSTHDARERQQRQYGNNYQRQQQRPFRLSVALVGIDVLFRVQSRDLMVMKLEQCRVKLEQMSPKPGPAGARSPCLTISAKIADIVIQDLRAPAEHTQVLIPNGGEEFCSLDIAYSAYISTSNIGPSLVIQMSNPRFLLLFRFVTDVMEAVDIVTKAVTTTKDVGVGVPAAAAAAAAAVDASTPKEGPPSSPSSPSSFPLNLVIQLHNSTILLPTSSNSRTVLAGHIDHLLLGIPGYVIPSSVLEDAELPMLNDMIQESLLSNATFRYGSYHDGTSASAGGNGSAEHDHPSSAEGDNGVGAGKAAAAKKSNSQGANVGGTEGDNEPLIQVRKKRMATMGSQQQKQQRQMPQEKDRYADTPGVIFLDESSSRDRIDPLGVLHIGDNEEAMLVSRSGRHVTVERARNKRGVEAEHEKLEEVITRGLREARQGLEDTAGVVEAFFSGAGTEAAAEVVIDRNVEVKAARASPSKTSRTYSGGGSGSAAAASDPMVLDEDSEDEEGADLPEAKIALCVENFFVERGSLVRVPNFYYQKQLGPGYINPRQGSFVPASLTSFSWPIEVWDLVAGDLLLHSCNLCFVIFDRPGEDISQFHFSSTPLTATVNAPNFTTIIDFIGGNLQDWLNPSSDASDCNVNGRGSAPAGSASAGPHGTAAATPTPPPAVKYNPNLKFGPKPDEKPKLRLTFAVPRLTLVLEAHPQEWTGNAPVYTFIGGGDAYLLRPFLRVSVSNLLFDLGSFRTTDMYMSICSTSMDIQDLRPAYRLEEVTDSTMFGDGIPLRNNTHESEQQQQQQGGGFKGDLGRPFKEGIAEEDEDAFNDKESLGTEYASAGQGSFPSSMDTTPTAAEAEAQKSQGPFNHSMSFGHGIGTTNGSDGGDDGVLLTGMSEGQSTMGYRRTLSSGLESQISVSSSYNEHLAASDGDTTPLTPFTETPFSFHAHHQGGTGMNYDGAMESELSGGHTPGIVLGNGGVGCRLGDDDDIGGRGLLIGRGARPLPLPSTISRPQTQTGIRLSVARRLSIHSNKKRSSLDKEAGNHALIPDPSIPAMLPHQHYGNNNRHRAAQQHSASGSHSHQSIPTPGRGYSDGTGGGTTAAFNNNERKYLPVVDFIEVPEANIHPERSSYLERKFNTTEDEDMSEEDAKQPLESAVLRVLTAPHHAVPGESPPVSASELPGANPRVKFEVNIGMLSDKTTAIEVAVSNGLINWPYFHDLSLIWSITNLFTAPYSKERSAVDPDAPIPPATPISSGPTSWLYFNGVFVDGEVFIPVYDVDSAQHLAGQLWDGAGLLAPGSYQRTIDLTLATMLLEALHDSSTAAAAAGSSGGGGAGSKEPLALEERGLLLGSAVMRFVYAYGGDGEQVIKADLRQFAAFVRDPAARVNCFLQPFSCGLELEMKVPQAAEAWEVERLHRAAYTIQRHWLRFCARQKLKGKVSRRVASAAADLLRANSGQREYNKMAADVERATLGAIPSSAQPWKLVDRVIMEVATPHIKTLLKEHRKATDERSQLMYLQKFRATASTTIKLDAESLTLRAAFSHIPFWKTAITTSKRVMSSIFSGEVSPSSPGNLSPSLSMTLLEAQETSAASEDIMDYSMGRRHTTSTGGEAATGALKAAMLTGFRPSSLQIMANIQNTAIVLCNDKPETFGAPDVLEFSVGKLSLGFDMATLLPDRPANKAGRLAFSASASFLNSGTSRWETIFSSWPCKADLVDIVSPLYLSDRKTNVWLTSEQHLDASFNPSSLLSIGDALSFYHMFNSMVLVSGSGTGHGDGQQPTISPIRQPSSDGRTPRVLTSYDHTTAAPQKYLIQNQSGMRVYYWADGKDNRDSFRSPVYSLENAKSEALKVTPAMKKLNFVQFSSSLLGSERTGSMINLHFEGNWMPVRDVSVNVVGKYRYLMSSPADNTTVPLIVDIILVGRTKIITLHSAIWVENSINRDILLRLHIPTTPLVPPATATTISSSSGGASRSRGSGYGAGPPTGLGGGGVRSGKTEGDVMIGPLASGSGCYLPLTAVLGGLLFLRPSGFEEASRDVIRLSSNITFMMGQQGYASCDPDPYAGEDVPLNVAIQAAPAKPAMEFQAFKHLECVAPGTIQRATTPLEAHLSIQPTMRIYNALPYAMRILLWQVLPPAGSEGSLISPKPSGTAISPPAGDIITNKSTRELNFTRRIDSRGVSLPKYDEGTMLGSMLEALTPRRQSVAEVPKRGTVGRYLCHTISPGSSQDIYADLRQNVLLHVAVEEIGMRSTKWSMCSWAQKAAFKGEVIDVSYTQRLPKEIPLRMVGVAMPLPMHPEMVATYLSRLKDAALHLRTIHVRFHKDTKHAVSRADVERAVGKAMNLAKKVRNASTGAAAKLTGDGSVRKRREQQQAAAMASASSYARASTDPHPPPAPRVRGGVMGRPPRPRPPVEVEMVPTNIVPTTTATLQKPAVTTPAKSNNKGKEPVSLPVSLSAAASPAAPSSTASPERGLLPSSLHQSDNPLYETSPATAAGTVEGLSYSSEDIDEGNEEEEEEEEEEWGTQVVVDNPLWSEEQVRQHKLDLMKMAFSMWRDQSAAQSASRVARTLLNNAPGSMRDDDDEIVGVSNDGDEDDLPEDAEAAARAASAAHQHGKKPKDDEQPDVQVRSPPVFLLGVHNTLADKDSTGSGGVCRITLHAPYWLNNRTGVDLFYQDKDWAPGLFFGATDVFSPGTTLTQELGGFQEEGSSSVADSATNAWRKTAVAGGGKGRSVAGVSTLTSAEIALEYKLVMMNKQEELRLGLAQVPKRKFSQGIQIKTVGNKGTVELKGPSKLPFKLLQQQQQQAAAAQGRAYNKHHPNHRPKGEAGTVYLKMPASTRPRTSTTEPQAHNMFRPTPPRDAGGHDARRRTSVVDEEEITEAMESMQAVPDFSIAAEDRPPTRDTLSEAVEPGEEGNVLATDEQRAQEAHIALERLSLEQLQQRQAGGEGVAGALAVEEEEAREEKASTLHSLASVRRQELLAPQGQPHHEVAEYLSQAEKLQIQKKTVRSQRLFEFAVDVAAGPPDSIYRHTKLVTLKPKYIIENQTGLSIEVKQLGTPDPSWIMGGPSFQVDPSGVYRFARVLLPDQRAPVYWDNDELPKELVIRPAMEDEKYLWSGGFPIPETEWYFGLRIRNVSDSVGGGPSGDLGAGSDRHMNIPVNVTVGSSGSVQVTLKSPISVPPYRIENTCKDVKIFFCQVPLIFRGSDSKIYVDALGPGEVLPYAWDEPTAVNKLRVRAYVVGKGEGQRGAMRAKYDADIKDVALDILGDLPVMSLPTHGGHQASTASGRLYRTLSDGLPDDLRQRLVSLLAAEFSKKVYLTVYADGPTRVLRFSEDKNMSSLEQQNVILDLAARLKQVETRLKAINVQFARLNGHAGAHSLDLYGRTPAQSGVGKDKTAPTLRSKPTKKLPLPSSAQALVRAASSRVILPSSSTSLSPTGILRVNSEGALNEKVGEGFGDGTAPPQYGRASSQVVRFNLVGSERTMDSIKEGNTKDEVGDDVELTKDLDKEKQQVEEQSKLLAELRQKQEREARLRPYKQLVIDTGVEHSPGDVRGGAGPGGSGNGSRGVVVERKISPFDSSPVEDGSGAFLGGGYRRDFGHFSSSSAELAGARSAAKDAATRTASGIGGGSMGSGAISGGVLGKNPELLRLFAEGDASLLFGGDLTIHVVQARGLTGSTRTTHPFSRLYISDPFPSASGPGGSSSTTSAGGSTHSNSGGGGGGGGGTVDTIEERGKQTNVVWQAVDPIWDEHLGFRDVAAAAELVVEIWDLGGSRSTKQLNRLTSNPGEVLKTCRFLGRAEIALADTLGKPTGTAFWYPLMRRGSGDHVAGQVHLRFHWDVSARGLLAIKLRALEWVLAQRTEILAALKPINPDVALMWKKPDGQNDGEEDKDGENDDSNASRAKRQKESAKDAAAAAQGGMLGAGVNLFGIDNELGMSGAGWAVKPSSVATEVLARHAHDHNRRNLSVTVLEARGLNPRRGVVVALSSNELPNPVVHLSLAGQQPRSTPVIDHSLNPRWEGTQRILFSRVNPEESALTIRLGDQRGGFRKVSRLLGEATIHCSNIEGESPVYVWVPLNKPKRQRGEVAADMGQVSELQVYLRLQWQTEVVRGASLRLEVNAAGMGLMVMGGLQDELFNFTIDQLTTVALATRQELAVEGSIKKVQLDNQMLDAVQPVVLAPATSYAVKTNKPEAPLISFRWVRSFAGSSVNSRLWFFRGGREEEALLGDRGESGTGTGTTGGSSSMVPSRESSVAANLGDMFAPSQQQDQDQLLIKSFKDFKLTIGDLDLMTDEAFMEAVLSFLSSIPSADIWQDRAWRDQQRRLLSAQFGPREVESLAVNNAKILGAASDLGGAGEDERCVLDWVVAKEAQDLEVLHGQSDLSSWFFIEHAEVSGILINVTVSMSSRIIAAGGLRSANGGAFNRALGASGFQLVNVGNVPISLGRWVVGSESAMRGRFSNGFLSQKALHNNLARHYTREVLKEAHKVLGGAGPAVASVPLTVLWASGSALTLLTSITTGTTSPITAIQQVFYVPLMSFSMIISGLSRMTAAGLALIPPDRPDSDDATVQRIIRRPNNALEALARAPTELVIGVVNGVSGVLFDPVYGWHTHRTAGMLMGMVKGVIGIVGRPLIGVLEAQSKLLQGIAMAFLGREGIVGKIQRRVRPPGAFTEEAPLDALEGEDEGDGGGGIGAARSEARVHSRALMAAWQRVLPEFFPSMANDNVIDVINIRATRVVLITDKHVAYLRAKHLRRHSIYKAKWLVPIEEIQNVSGSAETMKINLVHVHKYNLYVLGVWPVQRRKSMRCSSRLLYEKTVMKLSKLQAEKRGGVFGEDDKSRFNGKDIQQLTILSAPYRPPVAIGGEASR